MHLVPSAVRWFVPLSQVKHPDSPAAEQVKLTIFN